MNYSILPHLPDPFFIYCRVLVLLSYKVPPPNPATCKKICLQKILTGFGGSRSTRRAEGGLGTFDPDSIRSNPAVNQAKLLSQHQGLTPPLHSTAQLSKLIFCFYFMNDENKIWRFMQEAVNPASIRKIDKQTNFIGFGGGREGV
jgi:hypothetical protein